MKARNTQQLNRRLLAACEQPLPQPLTSLEDLIKQDKPIASQRIQLPVRYAKKLSTEQTVATAPTSTSINCNLHIPLQLPDRVPTHQGVTQFANIVQRRNEPEAVRKTGNMSVNQHRSLSPVRPVTPPRSPALVRLHSPNPSQLIQFKYCSPSVSMQPVTHLAPATQAPPIKPAVIAHPKQGSVLLNPQKVPDPTQHSQKEPLAGVSRDEGLKPQSAQPHMVTNKPPLEKLAGKPSSRILELNLKQEKSAVLCVKESQFPSPKNVISPVSIQQSAEPRHGKNPFEAAPRQTMLQPASHPPQIQDKLGASSPFEAQPTQSIQLEKSSIHHLSSIYSSEFLKREKEDGRETKPSPKQPKQVNRTSVGVGTSLHYQQIEDLEAKCRNFQRLVSQSKPVEICFDVVRPPISDSLELHYAASKSSSVPQQISTKTNSKSSTALSPFQLSHLLRQENTQDTDDSLYLQELRLERILRKYRSREQLSDVGYSTDY